MRSHRRPTLRSVAEIDREIDLIEKRLPLLDFPERAVIRERLSRLYFEKAAAHLSAPQAEIKRQLVIRARGRGITDPGQRRQRLAHALGHIVAAQYYRASAPDWVLYHADELVGDPCAVLATFPSVNINDATALRHGLSTIIAGDVAMRALCPRVRQHDELALVDRERVDQLCEAAGVGAAKRKLVEAAVRELIEEQKPWLMACVERCYDCISARDIWNLRDARLPEPAEPPAKRRLRNRLMRVPRVDDDQGDAEHGHAGDFGGEEDHEVEPDDLSANLTTAEASDLTGLAPKTIRNRVGLGQFPSPIGRAGRQLIFDREAILEWIRRNSGS